MINFEEYLKTIKVGDVLTIESKPNSWADEAGGIYGLCYVEYPYRLIIDNFSIVITDANRYFISMTYIAIKDTNGYGWNIKLNNCNLFKYESSNRKNRIDNLNL